jgi:hypothetical protein
MTDKLSARRKLAKKAEKKLAALPKEERDKIGSAARSVWDYVAYDALQMVQEMDGKDWVSRAEVLELATDAGRLEDQLKRDKHPELAEITKHVGYDALVKLLKPYFPYAKYGM